jgi:ankyrin repeat protein
VNAEHDGSALQAASSEGREGTVSLLIEHGADVNAQTRKYGTPLYAASLRGQHRIVRILIENGAKINGQGGPFGSALRAAFIKNKLDVARLLIDQGADVNERDHEFRVSLLQHAAYYGQCAAVRLLIKHGADVNAEGGALGSALDAARSKGHEDIENLLIRHDTVEILL